MKHGVVSSHHTIGIEERLNLRPTLSQGRWRRNPYEPNQKNWKIKIEAIILMTTALALFGLCFFHPYFTVRTYSFVGLERIEEKKLLTSIETNLSGKRFHIFSAKNYFSLDLQALTDTLNREYSFEHISLQKKFPHTLAVEIQEKPPVFIYDNGVNYILIGERGEKLELFRPVEENEWQVVTKTVSSTNAQDEKEEQQEVVSRSHTPNLKKLLVAGKKFPVVYDTRNNIDQNTLVFPQAVVDGISKWNLFLDNKNIPITFVQLLDGGEEGYIKTTQGWGIYVKFADADVAFPIFLSVLPQVNRSATQYVDMRYLNRVYWK